MGKDRTSFNVGGVELRRKRNPVPDCSGTGLQIKSPVRKRRGSHSNHELSPALWIPLIGGIL